MFENKITRALSTVNYKLLVAIFATMFLPTIYQTVRVFFLGSMPDDWGFSIASQLSWVNLCYEIIQEGLILPLFFLLGKSLNNKQEFENKVRSGIIVTGLIYFLFFLFIMFFASHLTIFMAQKNSLVDATVIYIKIESLAAFFSVLWRFIMATLIILGKDKNIYKLLILQTVLSIFLDTFLISNFQFSAKLGVNGIAINNIIVNATVLFVSFIFLERESITIFKKAKVSFLWLKEWFFVGKYSAIESLVRNVVFAVMIIKMVNIVSEQSHYWIANNFIWQWLLLPTLALSDLVKKEIGENHENIAKKTFGYIVLCSIFAIVWLITIPFWKPFLHYVMNVKDYKHVFNIVLLQTGFYLTFLFNNAIFDSTFYGVGKTNYMLFQSIIINIFYYGILFILYQKSIFLPSIFNISMMFGIGMVLDCIPTIILYRRLLRKLNVKIDYYTNK